MKRGIQIIIAATEALLAACTGPEINSGGQTQTAEEPREIFDTVETIFMSAVAYPQGYEWRKDPGDGTSECRLLLLEEGADAPLVVRNAGTVHEVSADSDMHRILDGHLYEDWFNECETIIRCDGNEIMRVEGREMIIDMKIHHGALYVLGADRSNGGFVLRKDGRLLARSQNIMPAGEMYEDNGELCFTGVAMNADGGCQWHVIRSGDVIWTSTSPQNSRILDLRQVDGEPFYVYVKNGALMIHSNGEEIHYINGGPGIGYTNVRIAYGGGQKFVVGGIAIPGLTIAHFVWSGQQNAQYHVGNRLLLGTAVEGNDVRLLVKDESGEYLILDQNGETFLPEGMKPLGERAMLLQGGSLRVALSDSDGNAFVWKDGILTAMGFNGYIDSIVNGCKVIRRQSFSR